MTTVVIDDANSAYVTFSSPVTVDTVSQSPGNYVIRNRLTGEGVSISAVSLVLSGGFAVAARLTTKYFFLRRGLYILNMFGLHYSGGSPVSSADVIFRDEMTYTLPGPPSPPASPFFFKMQAAIFSWIDTTSSSLLGNILYSIAAMLHRLGGDEVVTGGMQAARDGFVLNTAAGADLDVLGNNCGVARPFGLSDTVYRKVVTILSYEPKLVLPLLNEVLAAILGPQASVHWFIYEVRSGVVTVNLGDYTLLTGPLLSAYLIPTATSATLAMPGDYLAPDGNVSHPYGPLYLSPDQPQVPVLTFLFDLCRAAGIAVEFKKDGV